MPSGFVDEADIDVRAGDGGGGAVSFRRTKLQPRGGPDGGDGGSGGSVVLVSDQHVASLSSYSRTRSYRARPGGKGGSNDRSGANADDLILTVPVGTIASDRDTGEMLCDLARPSLRYVLARGGRGGRGNASLKSGADRVPNYAESGEAGEARKVHLELRLVADVGLVGPPNAGKSTLLAAVTAATPKVAEYPFTTLVPGLGVVEAGDERFVLADLPGLIEGASTGKGLGLRFLRHASRCRVLAAVVDVASDDPVDDLRAVARELDTYDPELAGRLSVVIGNKVDIATSPDADVVAWAGSRGARYVAVSAKLEDNLGELVAALRDLVAASRATQPQPESFALLRPVTSDRVVVSREGEGYRVTSERVERLVAQTPLGNARAVRRLQRRLRAMGVEAALAREGAKEGDEIRIGETTFEFYPEDRA